MHRQRPLSMVYGDVELRSPWFSSRWTLVDAGGRQLAGIQRSGRTYVSVADVADGTRLLLEPAGMGTVHALDVTEGIEGAEEVGRIVRRSWMGRRWDITGHRFNFDLVSDHMHRWHLEVANAPIATLRGSPVSYNHVKVQCQLGIPTSAVLLAWHVVARPWEAAAEPRGMVAVNPGSTVAGAVPVQYPDRR